MGDIKRKIIQGFPSGKELAVSIGYERKPKMKTNAQTEKEILRNANRMTSAELYLIPQAEKHEVNNVLAKLLNKHVIKFMSNSHVIAA